jgi:GNAT superfamily N-acetyltransferase
MFARYHYLSPVINAASQCFMALHEGRPIAFNAYLHFPHAVNKKIKIGHRLVVLPDYQGMSIGGKFDDWLGEYLHERGFEYHKVISHPALIAYFNRSKHWSLSRAQLGAIHGKNSKLVIAKHNERFTLNRMQYAFVYVP